MAGPRPADIVIAFALAAGIAALALSGGTRLLGAHPFWAVQTGIVGAIGGGIAFALLRWAGAGAGRLILIGAFGLIGAGLAAYFGKQAFVASYAENALAGRFWYFGWFALAGAAVVGLGGLIRLALPAPGKA